MPVGDMSMQTTGSTPARHAQTPAVNGWAVVDLDAIAHNVSVLLTHAGPAEVMAVVKADGYGHGAAAVARTAIAAGVAELGVATIVEALALRAEGITAPVLAWLHAPGTQFDLALNADVGIGISALHQIEDLLAAVARTGRTAQVTIKVDTGQTRADPRGQRLGCRRP
jgi:alanine racemase